MTSILTSMRGNIASSCSRHLLSKWSQSKVSLPVISNLTTENKIFSSARSSFLSTRWTSKTTGRRVVDLRSDTVTSPSRAMIECALTAPTGDDVFGEDETVLAFEERVADLAGKEKGLYVPTGTMSNLCGILAHCHGRASEIIVGSESHVCLWEGGNVANLGGIHSRQIPESPIDGTMNLDTIKDTCRSDNDDHFAKTELICLENTHNMMGGIAIPPSYLQSVSHLARTELRGVRVHVDGARMFNASIALGLPVADLCEGADSVSICFSKGLGAPLGSVLVGETETIRLAKRARKRLGGGMRQAGVVAAMGAFALEHNVKRLEEDHVRAKRIAEELVKYGFRQPQGGDVDTNVVYFGLPEGSRVSKEELCKRLSDAYGVMIGSGYSKGGELFRLCTHMDVDDEGVDRALEGLVQLCVG